MVEATPSKLCLGAGPPCTRRGDRRENHGRVKTSPNRWLVESVHRRIPGGEPWSGQAPRILLGTKLRSTNSASSELDGRRAGRGVKGRDNAPLSRGALDPAPGTQWRWCR